MFENICNVDKFLKIMIYGGAGTGKTLFSLGFPNPAIIDFEGGCNHYHDINFDLCKVDSLKGFLNALDAFEVSDYETLIIDPITILWEILREDWALRKGKAELRPQDWFSLRKEWRSLILQRIRNIEANVIVIAREKDVLSYLKNREKVEIVSAGKTFDGEKNLEYEFDLVLNSFVDGERFFFNVKKTRINNGLFKLNSKVEQKIENFNEVIFDRKRMIDFLGGNLNWTNQIIPFKDCKEKWEDLKEDQLVKIAELKGRKNYLSTLKALVLIDVLKEGKEGKIEEVKK